jgi:hypothetical protein
MVLCSPDEFLRPTGNDPPPIAPGALRIGVTNTDAFGVVADRFIASVNEPYADLDQVAL